MSISSDSEPAYNEFYDNRSISEGDSVDSFILRGAKKSRREKAGKKNVVTPGQGNNTIFGGIFAPFQSCCLSRDGGGGPHRPMGSGRFSGPLGQMIMQASQLSDSSDAGSRTSSEDEIALGALPQTVDTVAQKERRLSKRAEKIKDSEIRNLAESFGIPWRDLSSTETLDLKAKWAITVSLKEAIEAGWLHYTDSRKGLIGLSWCRYIELSERLTLRLLKKLLLGEEVLGDITIPQALKKSDDFSILEYVHLVEARMIEEIMGEFQSAAASATNTSSIYLIITCARTVAISCRQQGEVLLINVFDTGASKERGPGFFGFDGIDDATQFLIDLYSNDPLVKKSSLKFSAWTLRSKHMYQATTDSNDPYQQGFKNALGDTVKPVWDAEEDSAVTDDPLYQAKVVYNAMYNATVKPQDEENVFTHTQAGGINIQTRKK